MAELERDTAFLKLQIQKETMKNDLENVRSNYRQARLDEIANHLLVVEPRFEKYGYEAKCRLVHHLDEFAASHLPKCDLKTYFNDEIVCFIDRVLPKPFDPVEIMQQILLRGSHSSDDSTIEFVLKHESDLLMIDTTEIF